MTQQGSGLHDRTRCHLISHQNTVRWGGDLQNHLVRFQFNQQFVAAYRISWLVVQGHHGRIGDRLGKLGDQDCHTCGRHDLSYQR